MTKCRIYLGGYFESLRASPSKVRAKKKKKNTPLQSPPLSNSNREVIDQLETEKTQLQNQKTEIENQVATNPLEKTLKDQSLAQIIEQLKAEDKKIEKLKKALDDKSKNKKTSVPEKDNSKLNLAIGLGIAALVVGLLCFVLLLRKRRD